MKYALWNLDLTDTANITGPESTIYNLGGNAEGSWTNGEVQLGSDILGYITGEFATDGLSAWNYREITQEEALEFAQSIDPQAYLTEDGRIAAPIQE
jgi:hypothetical protein